MAMKIINKDELQNKIVDVDFTLNIESDVLDIASKVRTYLDTRAVEDYFEYGSADPYDFDKEMLEELEDSINAAYSGDAYLGELSRQYDEPSTFRILLSDVSSAISDALRTAVEQLYGDDPCNNADNFKFGK